VRARRTLAGRRGTPLRGSGCEMIRLTRLNGRPFVLNAEQIKTIEETPDTMVTLLAGDQVVVQESMDEVVRRAVEYARLVRTFQTR
jgi:flagellar protein FlbD